jgi:hypothetical protein
MNIDYIPVEAALRAGVRKVIQGVIISARTLQSNGYHGNAQATVNIAAMGAGLQLSVMADAKQAAASHVPTVSDDNTTDVTTVTTIKTTEVVKA